MTTETAQSAFIIYGPPLVGKTTVAQSLSRSLQWPHLNTDDIARTGPRPSTESSVAVAFRQARNAMINIAARQLHNGLNVIIDAALIHESSWEALHNVATRVGAGVVNIELWAHEDVLQDRLRAATQRPGQAWVHTHESLARTIREATAAYSGRSPRLRADTSDGHALDVAEQIRQEMGLASA